MFVVMFAIINLAYFAYGDWLRDHQVDTNWRPRSRARGPTRRPKSMTRRASTRRTVSQGPYSVGIWSTWMSASPTADPTFNSAPKQRCGARPRANELRPRSVVITGASRGLGFASATHLYKRGVACRRGDALARRGNGPRCARRPARTTDDARLIGVQLDLTDAASIAAAAKVIEEAVGAPYALVHNAGISAAGHGGGDADRACGSGCSPPHLRPGAR